MIRQVIVLVQVLRSDGVELLAREDVVEPPRPLVPSVTGDVAVSVIAIAAEVPIDIRESVFGQSLNDSTFGLFLAIIGPQYVTSPSVLSVLGVLKSPERNR